MSEQRIGSFEEFWPFYVEQHASKANRLLHFVGTAAATGLAVAALVKRKPWLLALAPVAGYGPAWFGHFVVEKNRPATFTYPLWSLLGDYKMWALTLTGRMDDEVARVMAERSQREAPARDERDAGAKGSNGVSSHA